MRAQSYRITIEGAISASWSTYFAGMALATRPEGFTTLSGSVPDQAALHGLLNRIRDLNLRLVSVQLLDADGATPVECRRCPFGPPAVGQE